jgi:hypothetical protein
MNNASENERSVIPVNAGIEQGSNRPKGEAANRERKG